MRNSQGHILLVDDEQHIADVIVYMLQEHGWRVDTALDGDRGWQLFKRQAPDLVILDLNLPGMPGLDLFREMKKVRPDIPVIMLTCRGEEVDRVLGLEMGADDYITKPFSARELAARVAAVLRRARGGDKAARVAWGPLELDPDAHQLRYFGQALDCTPAEFILLRAFLAYPARVYTREVLLGRLYAEDHPVTERTIDAYIKRLRRKLLDVRPGRDPIETVYGVGYKLNPDLAQAAP